MVDCVFINGKVVTVDANFSIRSAVAIAGERIVAVGGDRDILALAGAQTRIVDLAGRTLMPGLIDAHAHMDREGLKTVYPSLAGAASIADILERIEALVKRARPGEWIVTMPVGDPPSYWNPPAGLREQRWPTRRDLDQVSPENPVYIRPIWGFWRHELPLVSIANSRALEICGIDDETSSPAPSVTLEKDRDGRLTGVFIEHTYMSIVEMTLMRPAGGFTHEQRVEALQRSMTVYNSFGTTSIFEEHGAAGELVAAYRALRERGPFNVRANLLLSPSWSSVGDASPSQFLRTWGAWLGGRGFGDDYLRVGGLFALLEDADEGPRSPIENALRASAMPYTGWAGFHFDTGLPRDKLKQVLIAAAANGIRCAGLSVDLLDLYEEVNQLVPIGEQRWILGHVDELTADQISRIRDLGLVVSTHTNRYIWRAGARMLRQVGIGRENTISPIRSLMQAGVTVCLASDNVPVSMFYPIWQAVARRDRATGCIVAPDQRIGRADAIRAATINGAYLTLEEDQKGSIEPGKLADLLCVTSDPLTVAEDDIKDIATDFTVVGGRLVYQRTEGRPDRQRLEEANMPG